MSIGDPIIITSSVACILGNTTTYTVVSGIDYDSQYKHKDVNMTTVTNARTVNELSSFDVFRIVFFWILFVIGVIGNLFVVILVIWKRNRKQAVIQVLMCSMAVCDAGMLAIGWLLFAVAALDPNWPFGSFLCKFLTYVQGVTGDSSAWTIAIVGIDRFKGLSRPDGSFFNLKQSVHVLAFFWLVTCSINSPVIAFTDTLVTTMPNELTAIVRCVSMLHMTPRARLIYWLTGRVLVFLVPLVVTCLSYAGIYYRMKRAHLKVASSNGYRRNEASVQQQREQKRLTTSRKIGQMCLTLASAYALLWTPFQLTLISRVCGVQSITLDKLAAVYLLPSLNSCINPIIYGLMWKPFRQAFRQASSLLTVPCDGK